MSTIQIKRSLISGTVPASLADGELAINEVDEILFYKNSSGAMRSMGMPFASTDGLAATGREINGSMEIDQENQGASVTIGTGSGGKYVVDQWVGSFNHTSGTAVFSGQQVATTFTGTGLNYGFQLTSSTALVSPNIGDFAYLYQPVEAYRWESLNYGSSVSHSVSIGYMVYSTVTGTGSISIRNGGTSRSYVDNFTITAANTWQYFVTTIPGDQAGTWLTGSNVGAYVGFCFAAGSTYQTAAKSWVTSTGASAGGYIGTPQTTNFFATNGNRVIVTGVKILAGPNMPPLSRYGLLFRSSSEEISLCQRYFWSSVGSPYTCAVIGNGFTGGAYIGGSFIFPVQMRVNPTMTLVGAGAWPVVNCGQPVIWLASPNGFSMYAQSIGAVNCYYYPGNGQGVKANARM